MVMAYRVKLPDGLTIAADDQHSELVWSDKEQLLMDEKVHPYTKAYFKRKSDG